MKELRSYSLPNKKPHYLISLIQSCYQIGEAFLRNITLLFYLASNCTVSIDSTIIGRIEFENVHKNCMLIHKNDN